MIDLIKLELRKLLRNKAFYICLAICLVLLIINTIATKVTYDINKASFDEAKEMSESLGIPMEEPSFSALDLLKTVFSTNTAVIEGIAVSLIVCEDFSQDIIKNVYSKGYNRTQVYFSKIVPSLIAFLVILLSGMLVSFGLGAILSKGVGIAGKNYIASVFCIILVAVANYAIFYAICMIFKKTSLSIILCCLEPLVLPLFFIIIDIVINSDKFSVTDYWLTGIMSNLAVSDVETKTIITSIVVSLIVIAGFGVLSYFLHEKKDVKNS